MTMRRSAAAAPAAVLVLALGLVAAACAPGGAPPSASPPGAVATVTPAPVDPIGRPGEPPPALLAVDGGDPVVGQLGSFIWGDHGSDSPWLPGAEIRVGIEERLAMVLADGRMTSSWSVRRTRSDQILAPRPVPIAEAPGGPVAFDAPPPGRWSVEVSIRFAGDGTGSATYYWLITVT